MSKPMKVDPETMFALADDLMKAQADMINNQNELIKRLMDRVDKLEGIVEKPALAKADGIKAIPL